MTIDEAIKQAREKADKGSACWKYCSGEKTCKECEKENKQLAEWLEELKANKDTSAEVYESGYKRGHKEGYTKAIDEFAEQIQAEISESIIWDMLVTMNKNGSISDTSDKIVDYVIDTSLKIVEQLKAKE